jgi:hypothetical protein
MRLQLVFLFYLVGHLAIAANDTEVLEGGIRGQVTDGIGSEPLSYATIAIYNADSVLIDGGITG